MALGINDELGTSYMDLRPIPPKEAEKVDGVIIQTIRGTTNVAFGRGTVEASGQGQQVTAIGDRAALANSGIEITNCRIPRVRSPTILLFSKSD
jgi:hypothetical protein